MLRAGVVGLGRIGAALDADPGGRTPMTHAGGYAAHPGFVLAAVCDPDAGRLGREAARWGASGFASAREMMEGARLDVVSICAPTAGHLDAVRAVLPGRPKCVVMEKPLAGSLDEAHAIVAECRAAGVPLVVNFTRRFVPLYEEVRARIEAGARVLSASIKYAKGIRHNGSHAVALALSMFGEIRSARPLCLRRDHFRDDPTVAAHLACELCDDVHLQALDERCFTHFEFDVIMEDGRYTFYKDDFAALRYEPVRSDLFDCMSLRPCGEVETGRELAVFRLMSHVEAVCRGREPSCCDGAFALRVQQVCEELLHGAGSVPR